MAINESHQYNAALLAYAVQQPINGGTDAEVVAMFASEAEADEYAADHDPGYGEALSVVNVGTLHRTPAGELVA